MIKRLAIVIAFVAAMLGLNALVGRFLNAYYLQILIFMGINIILATSLNLINGYTGQFNLGHAGFMAIGAYASAAFSLFAHPFLQAQLGFIPAPILNSLLLLLSLASGILLALIAGLLIGMPTLRLRGDYLAIATLGFGEIIQVVINNMKVVGGATGLGGIPEHSDFFWVFLFAALTIWVVGKMTASAKGKSFPAIREDEIAALSLGISNTRVKVTAFVIGAGFAGLGGGLFAHFMGYLHVNMFGFLRSVEIVVMVVLGGMGNLWGVVIAAALLTGLSEALRPFKEWRMIIYSLLIIITMMVRSNGISLKNWRKASA